jgi:hypothetical protein
MIYGVFSPRTGQPQYKEKNKYNADFGFAISDQKTFKRSF